MVYTQTVILLCMVAIGVAQEEPNCTILMEEAGLDEYFGTAVAHRLHSLTLEDLRYYFKADAPEENNIPTVNFDLTENVKRVVPHAMSYGSDTSFKTIAMRHADDVLSNMDRKRWGIVNYSTIEKLVHSIHMSELWRRAQVFYSQFDIAPPDAALCACVSDLNESGVLPELELLALKIKFPGLTSGRDDLPYGREGRSLDTDDANSKLKFRAYEISYALKTGEKDKISKGKLRRYERKLKNFNFDDDEEVVVAKAMEQLTDDDQGLSEHLDSQVNWKEWKKKFKKMDPEDDFQFALFIYCMLN